LTQEFRSAFGINLGNVSDIRIVDDVGSVNVGQILKVVNINNDPILGETVAELGFADPPASSVGAVNEFALVSSSPASTKIRFNAFNKTILQSNPNVNGYQTIGEITYDNFLPSVGIKRFFAIISCDMLTHYNSLSGGGTLPESMSSWGTGYNVRIESAPNANEKTYQYRFLTGQFLANYLSTRTGKELCFLSPETTPVVYNQSEIPQGFITENQMGYQCNCLDSAQEYFVECSGTRNSCALRLEPKQAVMYTVSGMVPPEIDLWPIVQVEYNSTTNKLYVRVMGKNLPNVVNKSTTYSVSTKVMTVVPDSV
jgi:hypothetical protein